MTLALPAVTFVIEWENAIDVDDDWTLKSMGALESELRRVRSSLPARPIVMYLYDRKEVQDGVIENAIDRIAPTFNEVADVRILPTDGLTYYRLKNYGIARSQTELTVMIDSDAAPEPGWLTALLEPFADPEVMAVGGFTRLGYETLLDKAMALSWVFNLGKDAAKTEKRQKIHVNNCAVRTQFFQANSFSRLQAFKKQCVFWLKGIVADGHRYVRTAEARVVHAPHPGVKFLAWRA
ncbi:MAG: glycosyltransferase, partial [Sphingomicrobium sp.]